LQHFAWKLRGVATDRDPLDAVRAKLRDCREYRGLNYEEAGRRAGISGQWWRVLENGQQNITRTRLIAMAKAVEWPPNEALKLAGMPTLIPTEAHQLAGDPRERLTELAARLSDARVRALLYVARTMVDPDAAEDDTSELDPTVRYAHRIVDTPQENVPPAIPSRRDGNDVTP
jgi:transcriptional regulator with XRE-family HTH domain